MDLGIGDLNLDSDFDRTENNRPLADADWSAKLCNKDWFAKSSSEDESDNMRTVQFHGDRLYYSQQYEEALAKYQLVIAVQQPEAVKRDLRENIARCLTHLGRTTEAEDYTTPALKGQTPEQKSSKLLLQKKIHKKSKTLEGELLVTQRLISLNPYSYQLWFDLAELYVQVKETETVKSLYCVRHNRHNGFDNTRLLTTPFNEVLNHTSVADVYSSSIRLTEGGQNKSSVRLSSQKLGEASRHAKSADELLETEKSKTLCGHCLLSQCQGCRISSAGDVTEKTTCHDLLILYNCHSSNLEVPAKCAVNQSVFEPSGNCAKPELNSSDSSPLDGCVDCKIIACLACSRLCIKSTITQTSSFIREKLLSLDQQVENRLCVLIQGDDLVSVTQYLWDLLFSALIPGATLLNTDDDDEDDDQFKIKFENLFFTQGISHRLQHPCI